MLSRGLVSPLSRKSPFCVAVLSLPGGNDNRYGGRCDTTARGWNAHPTPFVWHGEGRTVMPVAMQSAAPVPALAVLFDAERWPKNDDVGTSGPRASVSPVRQPGFQRGVI